VAWWLADTHYREEGSGKGEAGKKGKEEVGCDRLVAIAIHSVNTAYLLYPVSGKALAAGRTRAMLGRRDRWLAPFRSRIRRDQESMRAFAPIGWVS